MANCSMKTAFFFARRYLFSQKKRSVVNIISWISLVGISVGSMALIVVLSVYNGIGNLTQSLFNVFDPELKIEAKEGKTFHLADIHYNDIELLDEVMHLSPIVEENMWITYKEQNKIATVRGVSENYPAITGIDTLLYVGKYEVKSQLHKHHIVMGMGVSYELGINGYDAHTPVGIHIPKRNTSFGFSFENAFNSGYALPTGSFMIQGDIDAKYILADINFVRELMNYSHDEVSSISVSLKNSTSLTKTKKAIENILGDKYIVKDRLEQQPLYYKIFKSERMAIFLVSSLILLIATLNLISSLSLLIMDKRKDIHSLRSMGATKQMIHHIFFAEGILISLFGVTIGLVAGFIICFVQQQFGIIKMGSNFVVNSFPVAMRLVDFVTVFGLSTLLSLVAVSYSIFRNKFE